MDKKDILKQIDHDSGQRVPDGYFTDFEARMAAMLPEQEWENEAVDKQGIPEIKAHRPIWQVIRPYVYMAAMFAGIWCMLQIFNVSTPPTIEQELSSNPVIAQALKDDSFVEDELMIEPVETVDIDEVYDEMYDEGINIDDLRRKILDNNQDNNTL